MYMYCYKKLMSFNNVDVIIQIHVVVNFTLEFFLILRQYQ